ncbi:MAG: hypothetical protein J6Y42_03370, partial [Bacilli bacterium]|nr:hypothetical protein [Bacilli bacterium]
MKVSIRLKIIILGAIVSLLITVVAGLSSILIYYKESVKHFENSIVNVLDNICNEIDTKDKYDEFIKTLKKRISNVYESDPDEPEFSSFSEKEEYYKTKYQFLYPKQGSFGLSLDDLTLRNNFLEFQTRLLDANNFARVKSVYISFYDEARNRIVFLVDSRHGDETEEYYLPGSYCNIESGVNYSSI